METFEPNYITDVSAQQNEQKLSLASLETLELEDCLQYYITDVSTQQNEQKVVLQH
jgi:ribosomal protein L33